ncbi:hypothetical protein [Muriicola sp.]|uniref:hypothetical protein n=1 Tax=Muriicola sp. TaxID=2020856 RepID=UPI003C721AEE
MALFDNEPNAQERLENFTFDFAAVLSPDVEHTSRDGGLFVSGSARKSKEDFENDLNAIFLGVSLFTQEFDLTTDQGAADAKSYLEDNQKIVAHFISFLIQQNQKLEEQNEGK